MGGQRGHFKLESGYHGGLWLDLDPLFISSAQVRPYVETLAERLRQHKIEAVCGPLVGGAFLAQAVAALLDVEFYYAERFAPERPGDSLYPVEYRLPAGNAGRVGGKAVAVVDDAISAGSAVRGALASLQASGARAVVVGALLVLGAEAERYCREQGLALEYVAQLPYELWRPADCPLCARGEPLEDRTGAG